MSLKKYFAGDTNQLSETLLTSIDTLLLAFEDNTIGAGSVDGEKLHADIDRLRHTFRHSSTAEMLLAAGAFGRVLQQHNQQATRHLDAQAIECRKVIGSFSRVVTCIATSSESVLAQLRDLEDQFSRATDAEEMRVLSLRIGESLDAICGETLQQRDETQRASVPAALTSSKVDYLSGLPVRDEAERAFAEAIQSKSFGFAAVFIVDRVHLINARFGYAAGDQSLLLFRDHLRRSVAPDDRLFRWTGPVFVVLLNRPNLPEAVRTDINRISSARLEANVQVANRSVTLPLVCSAAVFSLFDTEDPADIIAQLDFFIVSESRIAL